MNRADAKILQRRLDMDKDVIEPKAVAIIKIELNEQLKESQQRQDEAND